MTKTVKKTTRKAAGKTSGESKTVRFRASNAGELALQMLTPLQGPLKTLSDENYRKLRADILRDGVLERVSIWEDPKSAKVFILNGHQRVEALRRMRDEGYVVPQVPVSFVDAENLAEAKRLILPMASQYGTVNPQGLYDFAAELGVTGEEIRELYSFADFDQDRFLKEFFPHGESAASVLEAPDATVPMSDPRPPPEPKRNSAEISEGDFQEFAHKCPRCSFEFD